MTAPETGREIPAAELVACLRSDAASISRLRQKTPRDEEDAVRYAAAADLIEAQAARIASLEAERARTVEDTARLDWMEANPGAELAKVGGWDCSDDYRWAVHEVRGGRNDREWHEIGFGQTVRAAIDAGRRRALASEKGGQADG